MTMTAKKARYETGVEETLKRGYALDLDPQEYNRLLIRRNDGSVAGILFSPHRLGEEYIFVPREHIPRSEIRGTRREIDETLIKRGIDLDTAERIVDEHTPKDWRANAFKGASVR